MAAIAPDWAPPQALRQGMLFTARQAAEAGLSEGQIRHRRRSGRWVRYAGDALMLAEATPDTRYADLFAARLTWPDGVLCLRSAAAVHRLPVAGDGAVHVLVPGGRPQRPGVVPHRHRVPEEEILPLRRYPVTTVARTVLDCLGLLPCPEAESLIIWVLTREIVPHAVLARMLLDQPRARGNTQRRRLLAATSGGAMGPAEQRLHRLLRRAGIAGWRANAKVLDAGGTPARADALFAAERLILEVDGARYHGPDSFQADRTRQNRLIAAGYTVLRFTWADLTERQGDVVRQVRKTLARLRLDDRRRRSAV